MGPLPSLINMARICVKCRVVKQDEGVEMRFVILVSGYSRYTLV
jgi:hypothetical protein